MKKILKVLTAGMLALALTFGLMTTAVAAPGDAEATSEAAITKLVKVPFGTALPAQMDFEFVFSPVTYNESDRPADIAKMPVLGVNNVVTIEFTSAGANLEATALGVTTYYLESADIFAGITFDQAGVYEWELTENANTYTNHTETGFIEKVEYSKAVYTFKVYVDGEAGALEITHIGVVLTKDDEGEEVAEGEQSKSNPSPGGGTDVNYLYSQLIFTNGYEKTPEATIPGNPDPENPDDWTFFINKEIGGGYTGTSEEFDYSLTLTIPSLVVNESRSCIGYFVEETGVGTDEFQFIAGKPAITFTSGVATPFTLLVGQHLVFVDAPVGTAYAVSEARYAGFTPSVTISYTPASGPGSSSSQAGVLNEGLALPYTGANKTIDNDLLYVGEKGSSVTFVNTRGEVSATGITMADVPIIALVLLAAVSLIALAAIRARANREKKNAEASVSINSHDSN